MIVVDTNVIAYLVIDGDQTRSAEQVLRLDPEWVTPLLWRSEMRNVLMLYVRRGVTSLADAKNLMRRAEKQIAGREYSVDSDQVLDLAHVSGCSAYDCEFVGLAEELRVKLVTSDKKVLTSFPNTAVSMIDLLAAADR